MILLAADDVSAYLPLIEDWGTAGLLIVVFGLLLWWALPRFLAIAKLVNESVSTLKQMSEDSKKDREEAAEKHDSQLARGESLLQRAEEMYPKPQPKSGWHHIPPSSNPGHPA